MKTRMIPVLTLLIGAAEGTPQGFNEDLIKHADAVRATADEMGFKNMPWVTDLFEGLRLAQEERRPVFLVSQFGDPLDDC